MFDPYSLFFIGPSKTMNTFGDVHEADTDLATLPGFLATGRLPPPGGRLA